jgi:hypothetical protein
LFGGDIAASNLFRETNWDILEHLYRDKRIMDPKIQHSIERRMGQWLTMQRQVVDNFHEMLPEKLASFTPEEQEKTRNLIDFSGNKEKLTAFEQAHREPGNTFETLLKLWGYYDDPDRYFNRKKTAFPVEPVG